MSEKADDGIFERGHQQRVLDPLLEGAIEGIDYKMRK
jgi:hypothetical protein